MLFSPAPAAPILRQSPRPPPRSGGPPQRPDTSLFPIQSPPEPSLPPSRSASILSALSTSSPPRSAPCAWHPGSRPRPPPCPADSTTPHSHRDFFPVPPE